MPLSATTVMIPELDLRETVELLARLGFHGVEWRTRRIPDSKRNEPFSFWGNHKNDLTPERFLKEAHAIRKLCDDQNLRIVALAPQARADQLDEVKLLADAAAECSFCGPTGSAAVSGQSVMVRIGAPSGYDGSVPYPALYQQAVDAYGKALEITRARRVKILMEIHGGTIMVSASLAQRILANFDPKEIGAIYDPQNMVMDGFETPQMGMELLGPYLAHAHIGARRPLASVPDAQGDVKWTWEGCPLGAGLLNMAALFKAFRAVGYRGYYSLEDFRPGPAEPKLRESLEYLKRIGAT